MSLDLTLDRRQWLKGSAAAAFGLLLPGSVLGTIERGFTHAVASGDPGPNAVTLWTRFVSADGGSRLRVEVAEDERFTRLVASGETQALAARDHTARAVVSGLKPGRPYFYRFFAPDGSASPVGRTRTLPIGRLARYRIAVFSCANATSGWFNAYAHAAARDDLDLVVHLGDYIYESPIDRPDAIAALAQARNVCPPHETVALADYRTRYASYRADPDLATLHQAFPMIAVPDDHESANNAWKHGAAAHDPSEGPWPARKAAAMQAYHEWLPVSGQPYGAYQIGDLATLFRLETRLVGRDRQIDVNEALAGGKNVEDAIRRVRARLANPARSLLGQAQERWLHDALGRSVRAGTRWQVLAQQVIMGPLLLPSSAPQWLGPATADNERRAADLELAAAFGRGGLSTNLDRWDGYPPARDRLLNAAQAARANLVTLSGDSHNAWAYDLVARGKPAGVEFAGQSVSSFGMEGRLPTAPDTIAADLRAFNPELKWCDTSQRGYMVIELTPDQATAEWLFLPSATTRSTEIRGRHALSAERNSFRLNV